MDWKNSPREAMHWKPHAAGQVECNLCPRHCKPRDGQFGYCKVRGTIGDKFYTFNYGKSVGATVETIETEAIYHYAPGTKILSVGNIGCMMSCTFCQNWDSSQIKHLNPAAVQHYTPESIIETCLENNIPMISWTYNDPVVWHEFVLETSRLAKKHGIKTLYKSALYIEKAPLDELLEVMDIFSISLKSMDDEYYKKITKGRLQPVLDGIMQIHNSPYRNHLEISQLLVTELNDSIGDIEKTIRWVTENLGREIPIHFVAFHPAYKYTAVERTPVETLRIAKKMAVEAGIKYCYLGNVYEDKMSDTHCAHCEHPLVTRYGLTVNVCGIDSAGKCKNCGHPSPIAYPHDNKHIAAAYSFTKPTVQKQQVWDREVNSIHIECAPGTQEAWLEISGMGGGRHDVVRIGKGLSRRIVSKSGASEEGVTITWEEGQDIKILPVLDRAHFPINDSLEIKVARCG